ncbi:hypothetical protein SAMN06296386_11347 [Lachnospiraceae bacterium]|nr:hypothetical protein SAMN06296386_11347 [Lachnospiraceae bacterium]
MIISPRPLGASSLSREVLAEDKKNAQKIGPCGLGDKAIYLNSFFFSRVFYAEYSKIDRIFKRVAISKGGFTGKGIFASIPYLVVLFKNGTEQQCNFKYEEQVDQLLNLFSEKHPDIKTISRDAERRLAAAAEKEKARYLKELSPEAEASVATLRGAQNILNARKELSDNLAYSAKLKRTLDSINPTYRITAVLIFLAAIGSAVFGIYTVMTKGLQDGALFVLFGIAFILFVMSTKVLPSGRNNKQYGDNRYTGAFSDMEEYLQNSGEFPIPAAYAHPIVITRLIRVIREGRAKSVQKALEVEKNNLKALNPSVRVTQEEHDEVVIVKPLFTVVDYKY